MQFVTTPPFFTPNKEAELVGLERRRPKTGLDLMLSIAVLIVPVMIVFALLRACGSQEPTVVDSSSAIDTARDSGLFPVVVPEGLGPEWQMVQATFRRTADGDAGTLRLGYLAPGGGQLLLVVSNEETGALLARELGEDIRPQGEVTVAGKAWTSSLVRGDERALVQTETVRTGSEEPSTVRTIIVVGKAELGQLTTLAGSLR
jgi:hypothetical protein